MVHAPSSQPQPSGRCFSDKHTVRTVRGHAHGSASGPVQRAVPRRARCYPAAAPTLRRHDTGPEVVELQYRLAQIGSWDSPQRGIYGRHLQTAVLQFQEKQGVREDSPG